MSILDRILGKPLATWEAEDEKISVFAGIPILGLDGLSSAAYGPEAALAILIPLGAAGLSYIGPITLVILAILIVLYLSYRQTISAYPKGGGSYTVARENLGVSAGLLAAAALMLDYILNVAVGISAGIGALVSAVPALHSHILALCLATLVLITLVNLRGLRESGVAFAAPTYLFVGSLAVILVIGIVQAVMHGGKPVAVVPPPALPAATAGYSFWLIMRSFASGCTAMTGVEAVSNGVSAFAEPAVENAQRTLTAIVGILALLLAGIAYLAHAYGVGAMDQLSPGYQSIISQLTAAVVGRGVLYYVTLGSVLAVLTLSANTSFAGFPRLCRLIAEDGYLPHGFANVGRRLVYSYGIIILAVLSGLLLILFGGITDRLIPLFAVGAFGAFTLSQAGMVVHWRRKGGSHSGIARIVNGVGALATAVALAVILIAKFVEGAWITIVIIPTILALFAAVRRHYDHVARATACFRPMNFTRMDAPMVIVPIKDWSTVAERALRFAMRLSPDVIAVHIVISEDVADALTDCWQDNVEQPAKRANLTPPVLKVIASPYRRLFKPMLDYINELKREHPDRILAVVVPELVEHHWLSLLLHNHRATSLKACLWLYGDARTVVINVPWYLHEEEATPQGAAEESVRGATR
jgi:amino acid transporter